MANEGDEPVEDVPVERELSREEAREALARARAALASRGDS